MHESLTREPDLVVMGQGESLHWEIPKRQVAESINLMNGPSAGLDSQHIPSHWPE